MAQVQLNIKETKEFLRHIIENNKVLQANNKPPVSVEVEGNSGIGKTSSIKQLSEELKLDFVKLNLAQIEELGDLVGFPVRQFEMAINKGSKEAPKWLKTWVDEPLVESYKERNYQATGKSQMGYCPPEWIAGKTDGGILLLDDYNRADTRFLQATMELIDRQEYISWKLPKNWHIILSCNPDNGDYQVQSMDDAQKTRFISVDMKFDVDCWAEWAENAGIDGRCINFLLMNPELVTQETNSRSISTFFNAISSFQNFSQRLPMIQMIGDGSVGGEFSTMFTQFINNNLDKLVDPKVMLLEEDEDKAVKAIDEALHVGGDYRADIASVLATRLSNFTIKYSASNQVTPEITKRMIKLTTDEKLFTDDLRYTISSQVVNANKTKWSKFMMNPTVIKMVTR